MRPLRRAVLRPDQPASNSAYPGDDDPRSAHAAVSAPRLDATVRRWRSGTDAVAVGTVLLDAPPWDPERREAGGCEAWRRRRSARRRRTSGSAVLDACRPVGAHGRRPRVVQRPRPGPPASTRGPVSRTRGRSSTSPASAPMSRCGGPSMPHRRSRSAHRRWSRHRLSAARGEPPSTLAGTRRWAGLAACANLGPPRTRTQGATAMPEAVIVATGRTPIGRANKGSLVSCRPDDLAALVIKEVLAKVPGSWTRRSSRTSCSGAASPPAKRATTWPASPPSWPGWTSRGHRQPLLLVIAADHPDGGPRHQGGRG